VNQSRKISKTKKSKGVKEKKPKTGGKTAKRCGNA